MKLQREDHLQAKERSLRRNQNTDILTLAFYPLEL